jgi:DNA-binding transcriptional LysR family regulator
MDLNQLAVFVRVVDQGSFTKAAKALKKPKSRVSRNIAALEQRLGVPLLYRSTRQLSLTEAGLSLYRDSKDHVYGLESVTESLRSDPKEVSGVLKLTAAEDMGSMLFGKFISELTEKYPKLRVELHFSNDWVDLVKEGLDVALRIGELEDTTLKARRVGWITSILVASSSYLKNAPKLDSLKDIGNHPTLCFSSGEEEDEGVWTLSGQGKQSKVQITPLCQANNPKTVLDLALAGKGVGLIPDFLCIDLLQQKKLVRLLPAFSTRPVPVHFVWPQQRGSNPKLRACVDFGVENLARYFK